MSAVSEYVFGDVVDWLKKFGKTVFGVTAYIFTPFSTLLVAVGYLADVTGLLDTLHANLSGALSLVHGLSLGAWYAKANRLAPLNEAFSMVGFVIAAKVTAVVVRIIKSWIPTVS